jgi:ATP-binding cassette, subfamily F, member 3
MPSWGKKAAGTQEIQEGWMTGSELRPFGFAGAVEYHRRMAIVSFQDVHFGFESQVLFDGLDWTIHRGEKVGLVGPNGSGKTTLFRLILGQLAPQVGSIARTRGLQTAYLPQEPMLDSSNTLFAEVATTFDHLQKLEDRLADVSQRLAEQHETDQYDELMSEYEELQHRLESAGGYRYETLVKQVLGGLGFSPADCDLPISALSGGQKCRAALAQLLLQEADLLLLDEPTNHLDIEATRFLESFVAEYQGAAVIISHDRYLLDRVAGKIADLDARQITVYPCRYSDYAESKQLRQLTAEREYTRQQEWLHHQREYAERVKADKSRSRQAAGRLKHVERLEREGEIADRPSHMRRRMSLQLTPSRRGGEMVLRCTEVRKAYDRVVLFDGFNLEVYRGEKIGIIGPNGVGKSTLLKMAMRLVQPDAGEVRLFENLEVGYYDQEHSGLNPDHRVIDVVEERASGPLEARIRSYLARFLFFGDSVYKRVGDLSGGEQSRAVLARLVWKNPQVLVLDEPTNHLDIPAREALEEALIEYEGAILLVSHDRYFLDRVVNRLLVLPERGKYELLIGNWSTYDHRCQEQERARLLAIEETRKQARREARLRVQRTPRKSSDAPDRPGSPYGSWSLSRLEEEIIARERRLAEAEGQFADPDVYRDAERARGLRTEVESLRAELRALNTEWEARVEQES